MTTKAARFSDHEIRIARIAKALSHPARIRILRFLADCGRCMTGRVVEELPLAQATVSQHLRELRDADLIVGEIEGPATNYCLNPETLRIASTVFAEWFSGVCCAPATVSTTEPEMITLNRLEDSHA